MEMVDFAEALRSYIRFGYCTSLNNIATFGELIGGSPSVAGNFGIGAARYLHNAVCNRPAPQESDYVPFTGGQCLAEYNVSIAFEYTTNKAASSPTWTPGTDTKNFVPGAIEGLELLSSSGGAALLLRIKRNGGYTNSFGLSGSPADIGIRNYRITSVVKSDGSPDTCGNPNPVIPPYQSGDNSYTNNITYTNNDGDTISLSPNISFGYGKVNVSGELTIPFTLNLNVTPTVNITGSLNLNTGDINYNAGNPALPPNSCGGNSDDFSTDPDTTVPTSPDSPDVPDPDPDPDKPEYRKLLVGVLVTTSTVPKDVTVIYQSGHPNVYAPDLGLVSFQVSIGGVTGWTEDFRVKRKRQFIPCPWKGGAIAVNGSPRQGGAFSLTPVYERQTVDPTFPD